MLRSVRFWVGLGVSLVFIALFFRQADLGKVIDALRNANYWWFLPAAVLYIASLWVRSLRYHFLVRDLGEIPTRKLFPVLCIAFMANNLIPARAGEVVRAYVMREKFGVSMMSAFGTVVVERLCDGLTLLLFFLATVAILGANSTLRGLAVLSVAIFVGALAVFGAILKWPRHSESLLHRIIDVLPAKARPILRDLVSSLLSGMVALRDPRALAAAVICSPLAWFMEALVFLLVGRSFGLHLNIGWFMMAMAAGNLALTVPSSQGGIGPFEFFAKQVLVFAHAGEGVAAAYVLAAHAMIIIPVTVLGLIYLSVFNVSLSRAISGSPDAGDSNAGPAHEPRLDVRLPALQPTVSPARRSATDDDAEVSTTR